MTIVAGYANTTLTACGTANFWVATGISFSCAPSLMSYNMTITLSGYASGSDAMSGCSPMGIYTFQVPPASILSIFGASQTLVTEAIVASSPDWTGVTYVAAVP
jgi:hypothetical protein